MHIFSTTFICCILNHKLLDEAQSFTSVLHKSHIFNSFVHIFAFIKLMIKKKASKLAMSGLVKMLIFQVEIHKVQ